MGKRSAQPRIVNCKVEESCLIQGHVSRTYESGEIGSEKIEVEVMSAEERGVEELGDADKR
jgi:hypothetical protein